MNTSAEKPKGSEVERRVVVGAGVALGVMYAMLAVAAFRRQMEVAGRTDQQRFRDFFEFFSAAEVLWRGEPVRGVFTAGYLGYVYPPMIASYLSPLVPLGLLTSARMWTVFSLAALAVSTVLAARYAWKVFLPGAGAWAGWVVAAAGTLLVFDKLQSELKMQQSNVLLLLGWVLALGWSVRGPAAAGLGVGLGVNIKYLHVLALPYYVWRRLWKAPVWAVVGIGVFALTPAVFIGWDRTLEFWQGALTGISRAGRGEAAADDAIRVFKLTNFGISITTVLLQQAEKLGLTTGWLKVIPWAVSAGIAAGVLAVLGRIYRLGGVSFGAVGRAVRQDPTRESAGTTRLTRKLAALEAAGLVVGALAFSPQTNPRHLVQALFPLVIMSAACVAIRPGRYRWIAVGSVVLIAFSLVFPPGGVASKEMVVWWFNTGAISWCMLAGWLTVTWATVKDETMGEPLAA